MKSVTYITVIMLAFLMFACLDTDTLADESDSMMSVQKRLQRLEDREAIRELLYEYGRDLDREDFRAYSRLFAREGVWEGGIGSAKGPEEIHAMLDKVFGKVTRGQYGSSYHIMSDITIKVDGNTAKSRSHWTWVIEGKDGKPTLQRSGHYEDVLVREDGEWKFKYRLTVTEMPTKENDSESGVFRSDWKED